MQPVILLPGILLPGAVRYQPLLKALGPQTPTLIKELEVYAGDAPPEGYSFEDEVRGLAVFADAQGLERFHVYGHSGGGAVALAYAAAHGDRLLSVAVDEPASDFSAADRELMLADRIDDFFELPPDERMVAFVRNQLRPGVEFTPPPPPPPSPEMAKRPAGVAAFGTALLRADVAEAAVTAYARPVFFSYGSLSNARWEAMAHRLEAAMPDCTVERFEGLHHMNTSNIAEPERVAGALRALWARADES